MLYINYQKVNNITSNELLQHFLNNSIIEGAEVYCIMPVSFLSKKVPDYFTVNNQEITWNDILFRGGDTNNNFYFSTTETEVVFLLTEEPNPTSQNNILSNTMLRKHLDYLWNRKFSPKSNIITRSLKSEI